MAENSKIQWTHHTFNPWRGCTKVSEGCSRCYADTQAKRNPKVLGTWGPNGTRVVASEQQWAGVLRWDRSAKAAGERRRVFCASMADVFEAWEGPMVDAKGVKLWKAWHCDTIIASADRPKPKFSPLTMSDVRNRLYSLIKKTPHLDWLLLTKRPQNIARFSECDFCSGPWKPPHEGTQRCVCGGTRGFPSNVWLGTTVENRRDGLPRIEQLRKTVARVRFLSVEPLLEDLGSIDLRGIDWVIVGGESGHHARSFDLAWARSIVEQCKAAGVPCFVKQLGERPVSTGNQWGRRPLPMLAQSGYWILNDKKGGDPAEWPEHLQVREFPRVTA